MEIHNSQGGIASLFPFQSLTLQGGGSSGGKSKISLVRWTNLQSRDGSQGGAYEALVVGGKKSVVLTSHDAVLPATDNTRKRLPVAGLANLGNTCFMNSILQCLMHTRPLLEYCLTGQYRWDVNKQSSCMRGQLVSAYVKVMEGLSDSTPHDAGGVNVVSPYEFKSQIARFAKRFVGNSQHDAHEFLMYLLEGLHEDLNRSVRTNNKSSSNNTSSSSSTKSSNSSSTKSSNSSSRRNSSVSSGRNSNGGDVSKKEDDGEELTLKAQPAWQKYKEQHDSKIIDTFVGQLRSTLICSRCGHTSDTFEPFLDLSLPIGQTGTSVSLLDCLQMFLEVEELTGDECPTCSRCKCRTECSKSFSIEKFPQILIIHLKRFSQGMFNTSKLYTTVKCPHSLDLSNLKRAMTHPQDGNDDSSMMTSRFDDIRVADDGRSLVTYRLYAVSNHSGSTRGGHYTATARHPYSGAWHYFNDSRVSDISEKEVITSDAYILMYELVETTTSRL